MTDSENPQVACRLSSLHGTPVLVMATPDDVSSSEIRRILGATYLSEHGLWAFPAYWPYLEDVLRDLALVLPQVSFDDTALKHIEDCRSGADKDFVYRDGFSFVTKPFEHQEQALKHALKHLRCGIFYDMGLGKTKIVIDLLRHERQKALILAPVVGINTWYAEIQKHAGGELNAMRLIGASITAKQKVLEQVQAADVLLVTYDTAKRYTSRIISKFPYKIIVADESHHLRSHGSGRTATACELASRAPRRIIMSGTPSLGNPLHLYGQLSFLGPYIPGKDFWTFRKHHTITQKTNPRIIVGYKNLEMLNQKVQRVCIKKMKEECLDLPPRTIIDVPFSVAGEQCALYNRLVIEACAELEQGVLYEAAHAAAVLQKLLQVLSGMFIMPQPPICDGCEHVQACVLDKIKPFTKACLKETTPRPQAIKRLAENPKLEALEELLEMILAEERNKVIVWAYFKGEMDIVSELLESKGISYLRVDGSNSHRAHEYAEEFNKNPEIRVYLGQISTGVALTLTSAAYMCYFGLSYKLDDWLQSLDRNYRIGQASPVFVYRLIAEKSVLAYVALALSQKEDIAAMLTDRIDCVLCDRGATCLRDGIKPFSKGCVYKDKVTRVITKPEPLDPVNLLRKTKAKLQTKVAFMGG